MCNFHIVAFFFSLNLSVHNNFWLHLTFILTGRPIKKITYKIRAVRTFDQIPVQRHNKRSFLKRDGGHDILSEEKQTEKEKIVLKN